MTVIVNFWQHQRLLCISALLTATQSVHRFILTIKDKTKADHTTLLLAVQLLFIAYVLSPTNMATNRTTLLLAVEVLCAAEFLSQGLAISLAKMIGTLTPRTPHHTLSTTIGVVFPFMVNLHFIRCFLEQLQPEAQPINFTDIQRTHIVIAILCILLPASGVLLGTWRYLRASRSTRFEDRRRGLQELWNTFSALFDAFIGLLLALRSHQLFWQILVTVSQSRNILEARLDRSGIPEAMNEISRGRVLLGWLLELQTAQMGRFENMFPGWFLDALDMLQ